MIKRFILILTMTALTHASEWTALWPSEAPGAPQPPQGSEYIKDARLFVDVEIPQYQFFPAENPTGHGIVILPGGGYQRVSFLREGTELAAEYAKKGISAMVVKYRVSSKDDFGYQHPVPLLDARRALRTMRHHAKEWKINPAKIGIIGFSAGGHLAACASTMFEEQYSAETTDHIDALSCRPDYGLLIYPVIGMGEPWGHQGSHRRLLGKNPSEEFLNQAKPLNFISAKTPPIYFIHSADDGPVPLRNSMEFAARCAEKKVKVDGKVFATGGHGYGWKGRGDAKGWTTEMINWVLKQ